MAEHLGAFERHSRYAVTAVNTDAGFPPRLAGLSFDAIVLHYSLFAGGPGGYLLDAGFLDYLRGAEGAYKLAFFQDEHHWCRRRFAFIDDYGVHCVVTMLEPPHAQRVYGERTNAERIVTGLPGYAGPELERRGARFAVPETERRIDIGYRGRQIPAYMGRGALEKCEIGERFAARARDAGLVLDIEVGEWSRLYGADWDRFMAGCRAFLGTESGVSCFDLDDEVRTEYEQILAAGQEPTVERLEQGALGRWDWNIPYRTISPRHLEAAALRVCQILYEGDYSGAMKPMRHYIPLRKDFSNFDEVIERFGDRELRRELTDNAYGDLIASGDYGYERMIDAFDSLLADAGVKPHDAARERQAVARALRRRPAGQLAARWIGGAWYWLEQNHPRAWRGLHLASRPVVAPVRAITGIGGSR